MRRRILGVIPYFLAGVTVGVFIDRILGGPGGNSGFAAVVSAVAAAFALSGPLLQERMRQGAEEQRELKLERKEHAVQIAESTLRWLGRASYSGNVGWAPLPERPIASLQVILGDNSPPTPVESLAYWQYAVEHFTGDPEVGPAWRALKEGLEERASLKAELDSFSAQRLREAFIATFGPGFVPGSVWDASGPARSYWEQGILDRLRYTFDPRSFADQEVKFAPGPESPGGTRYTITYGGSVTLASTTEQGLLEPGKFGSMCSEFRQDPAFRARLAKLQGLDETLSELAKVFSQSAWRFYERVSGSKQIPGSCGLCPRPEE